MGTAGGKSQYRIPHIRDVIVQVTGVCVLQYLVDKVDTGLSSGMYFFLQITLNKCSKPFLAFDCFKIYHFVFSFHR